MLEAIQPSAVHIATAVHDELAKRHEQLDRQRKGHALPAEGPRQRRANPASGGLSTTVTYARSDYSILRLCVEGVEVRSSGHRKLLDLPFADHAPGDGLDPGDDLFERVLGDSFSDKSSTASVNYLYGNRVRQRVLAVADMTGDG